MNNEKDIFIWSVFKDLWLDPCPKLGPWKNTKNLFYWEELSFNGNKIRIVHFLNWETLS